MWPRKYVFELNYSRKNLSQLFEVSKYGDMFTRQHRIYEIKNKFKNIAPCLFSEIRLAGTADMSAREPSPEKLVKAHKPSGNVRVSKSVASEPANREGKDPEKGTQ